MKAIFLLLFFCWGPLAFSLTNSEVVPEEEYYESDYEVTDGAQKDFKTVRDDVNYSESAIEENPVYPDEEILYEGPAGESEMDEF